MGVFEQHGLPLTNTFVTNREILHGAGNKACKCAICEKTAIKYDWGEIINRANPKRALKKNRKRIKDKGPRIELQTDDTLQGEEDFGFR